MTHEELLAFHASVTSFAVLSDVDAARISALSEGDRRALYDLVIGAGMRGESRAVSADTMKRLCRKALAQEWTEAG